MNTTFKVFASEFVFVLSSFQYRRILKSLVGLTGQHSSFYAIFVSFCSFLHRLVDHEVISWYLQGNLTVIDLQSPEIT